MFLQTCKKLNYPEDSLSVLENAYQAIMANPETVQALQTACDSLLKTDYNVFREVMPEITQKTGVHPYTADAVVQVCCVEPLRQMYVEDGFSEKYFEDMIKNLRSALIKCMNEYKVWGTSMGFWQWVFHARQCFRLGRLAFEPMPHFCEVSYKGIKKGDPVVLIHIPADEHPLDSDAVMDSLKQGYAFFKNNYPDGIVPFVTHTWLLYPPYMDGVFPKNGNVQKFAALFHILSENVDEKYENFPAVFGCPYKDADFTKLPQKTSLQRNLLAYLKQGNPMGQAYGIFFYDENGIVD